MPIKRLYRESYSNSLQIMYKLSIVTIYRITINYFYSGFYILSIIVSIWTIYTFSVKSCYSYLNIFSILPPISLYWHLYILLFLMTGNTTLPMGVHTSYHVLYHFDHRFSHMSQATMN